MGHFPTSGLFEDRGGLVHAIIDVTRDMPHRARRLHLCVRRQQAVGRSLAA